MLPSKKRREKEKKAQVLGPVEVSPQPPVMCWICMATCTQGFHCLLLVPWVFSAFPPSLLPRGPGFIQHGHRTSTQELCSFTQAPPGQSQGLDQGGRSGLQEVAGTQTWEGRKGEILGDPRSSFACCHYFTTWGRSPLFRKGKKEGLKKLMKILEGGGRGPWSQWLPKKKKKCAKLILWLWN